MIEQEWAIILARIQFAFTVSFHFPFPAFSIGLASFLAVPLSGRAQDQQSAAMIWPAAK